MYQKYHTEALVLGNRESGEADRVVVLYTRDFGLVRARASAIRREGSKMRYALSNYSRARVALVRGKHGWRLAGASSLAAMPAAEKGAAAFARIAELVARLVAGEEADAYLFDVLSGAHAAFMAGTADAIATVELVCVARTLYALGYISAEALGTALFTHATYADDHLREAEHLHDELLSSINRAISETHL